MASVQGIYVALFGRPADPAGLAYFNGLTNNGANLAGIVNLSGQPEYISRFTGLTNEQIVNTIFQSLFGRDAEPAGLSFYVGQLAAGKLSINTIAINILDGAAGADKTTVDAKVAAANLFTSSIDTPAEIAAYSGDAAAALARTYISGINANNPATEAGVNAAIQTVVASGGQEPGNGGGGGGGGSQPIVDFTIVNGELGLVFGGSARGTVTLGWDNDLQTVTGSRSSQAATFPDGPVRFDGRLDLSTLDADLVLENELGVKIDANEASGFEISGEGSVKILGSEGEQAINVAVTLGSVIEGGRGADVIDITGSTGSDLIVVKGVDAAIVDAEQKASSSLKTHEKAHSELVTQKEDADSALALAREEATDESVFAAKAAAEAKLTEAGGEDGLSDLQKALTAATDVRDERALLEKTAEAAATDQKNAYAAEARAQIEYGKAYSLNDKVSAYDANALTSKIVEDFTAYYNHARDSRAEFSNYNVNKAREDINSLNVEQALKDLLLAKLPANVSNNNSNPPFDQSSERDAFVTNAKKIISDYKASVSTALDTRLDDLTKANAKADDAHDANVAAAKSLDDHKTAHTGDLAAAVTAAEDAVSAWETAKSEYDQANDEAGHRQELIDTASHAGVDVENSNATGDELASTYDTAKLALDTAHHDSHVGGEDHVVGFELGRDHLELPSTKIVADIADTQFEYQGNLFVINVTNGVATLALAPESVERAALTPFTPAGESLVDALKFLSNDKFVGDGETIGFYFDADNDGNANDLYVFQGSHGETDIGVVLIGVENVTDLSQLFDTRV